ncbi:MAG: hypothetical protein KH452_13015 [Clostridiales bacterium]|nr:hypothetical protein [Clostridiales bacterium]
MNKKIKINKNKVIQNRQKMYGRFVKNVRHGFEKIVPDCRMTERQEI